MYQDVIHLPCITAGRARGRGGVEEGGEEEEQERRPPPAHIPVSYSMKGEGRRDIGIMCYVV